MPSDSQHSAVRQFSVTVIVEAVVLKLTKDGFLVLLHRRPDETERTWQVPMTPLGGGETIREALERLQQRVGNFSTAHRVGDFESPDTRTLVITYLVNCVKDPIANGEQQWFPVNALPSSVDSRGLAVTASTAYVCDQGSRLHWQYLPTGRIDFM